MTKLDIVSTHPFVTKVRAERLSVGKQLLTPDGWQTIKGLMVFDDPNQVSVFTQERDDEQTDGWRHHFGDIVQTRLVPTAEDSYQQKRKDRQERRRQRRLAMAAAACPEWCVEHYDGQATTGQQRNHASEPLSVDACDVWTGKPVELGLWLERRDDRETGDTETVGVLEVKTLTDDIELSTANLRLLAAKLNSLADRGELRR